MAHVDLSKVDLSRFTAKSVKLLKEWAKLTAYQREHNCPFDKDYKILTHCYGHHQHYPCRNFCHAIFHRSKFSGWCPCRDLYSRGYVINTVKAIIKYIDWL